MKVWTSTPNQKKILHCTDTVYVSLSISIRIWSLCCESTLVNWGLEAMPWESIAACEMWLHLRSGWSRWDDLAWGSVGCLAQFLVAAMGSTCCSLLWNWERPCLLCTGHSDRRSKPFRLVYFSVIWGSLFLLRHLDLDASTRRQDGNDTTDSSMSDGRAMASCLQNNTLERLPSLSEDIRETEN